MNEVYEKMGSGINKIQNKIQSTMSIGQYQKIIQDTSLKRTETLIQLGEEVYKKIRNKEIESEELMGKATSLIGFDCKIYQAQQAIDALNFRAANHVCPTCGDVISEGDKFCGGCGAEVEFFEKQEVNLTKECLICEELILENASFCNCCGTKLV